MKINTLKYRGQTVKNVETALEELVREYQGIGENISINLGDDDITVLVLGKVIKIDYYKLDTGKFVQNYIYNDNIMFEKADCISLSVEEIKGKIIDNFIKEIETISKKYA